MSDKPVLSKQGEPIEVGDQVWTPFRGGKHEGVVEHVLKNEDEIEEAGNVGVTVKNPPKVIFTDQNDKVKSHNPGTLSHS